MRNRLFILLSALLFLVLAVPAAAGGTNGNGMRVVSEEEADDLNALLYMPICESGNEVGGIRDIPSHFHMTITIRAKSDGSRVDYLRIQSNASDDGDYRTDYREHQAVNSIDVEGTGHPDVYNDHGVSTWSDPDGVYAEQTQVYHTRWDKDGNQTFDSHDTGFVCLRDTITP